MKNEIKELTELVNRLEKLKRFCWICGKKEVTKHSIKGKHLPPFIYLCRDCHDFIELFKLIVQIMKKEKKLSITRFKLILKELTIKEL